MTSVLLVTDADWLFDRVSSALCDSDTTVSRIGDSRALLQAVESVSADLVVLDLQVGTKGGFAAAIDFGHDVAMGRCRHAKVLLLLDRDADRWLASQVKPDGWVIKPFDAITLKRAAQAVLSGDGFFQGQDGQVEADGDELVVGTEAV